MIKKVFPETKYEKEALLKAFLLFFLSIETLLSIIFFLYYKNKITELKNEIFLEMKNYSYTFEGNKFKVDILENVNDKSFYQLYEDKNSLYIIVPIPGVKNEGLKIEYPIKEFQKKVLKIRKQILFYFFIFSIPALLMSFFFAIFSLYPVRKGIFMINEFIKDIIHDLNTPVSTILINLKLLKLKEKDNEEIERIEYAAKQLTDTYENLKLLIKETEKSKKEFDISHLLREEIKNYSFLFPDIKVKLEIQPLKIKTDETAVRRILSNLISNAFKHNIPKGWVMVKVKDNQVIIENSSRPLKNPDKVFDRYYKEGQRGIGIGLSIVKKLCKEIGCKVSFEHKNDKTTVKVIFDKAP